MPTRNENAMKAMTVSMALVTRNYRAQADKVVAPLGLSAAMAWPLVLIGRHAEGVRPGTLSAELGIEGPSLVRSLNQLVDAGLVLRHEDNIDKRAKILHLTPAGRAISVQIEALLIGLRATLFDGILEQDLQACLRTFSSLEKRLGINGLSAIDAEIIKAKD